MAVAQQSDRRSHRAGLAPCLLLMLVDWSVSQTRCLTILSFHSVVKPPFSCPIPMVSAAHWLTPTPLFLSKTRPCRVGIWIVLAFGTTDFDNQKASHYISGSQWWSMMERWITDARYSNQALGVFNISPRSMECGTRGEEGVSKVLEIVSKVGRQSEYICRIGGVFLIRWHHLGCYSARKQFA